MAEERPLGGTETAVIRLARALHELGHTVRVLTRLENPPLSLPLYLPLSAINQLGPADILISVRDWKPLFLPVKAERRLLWTGDAFDQPVTVGIGDKRIIDQTDVLLCVSNWHADTLCAESGFPREKAWVMRNGIDLSLFKGAEIRVRKRLMYSSTPYRGLAHLLSIFPKILERHPDAELHIFSGYEVYKGTEPVPDREMNEFKVMMQGLQRIPNVFLRGNMLQRDLAREFMSASVLAYPNTFAETSCITAMEAQAGGCVVVSTKRAGLIETVADAGVLIEGSPGTESYDNAFIDAVDKLLGDDDYFAELSRRGKERAVREFDWRHIAEIFCSEMTRRFGETGE